MRSRTRLHWTTAAVLFVAVTGSLVAAAITRSVRDENEDRLLRQRAEAIGQLIEGLGSSFEADLTTAAAYASLGTTEEFAAYVDRSREEDTASSTWALVDRDGDGYHLAFVAPDGAVTYFDGPGEPLLAQRLGEAFGRDFTILGLFGGGFDRRLAIAAGVPDTSDRIVYLEFPLLAAAASDDSAPEGLTLFEGIDVGLYVGDRPTAESQVFATYDGDPPSGATRRSFRMGDQEILVLVDSHAPLSGELANALPGIVLAFGLSIGALAALLIEGSRRKQRAALVLADELRRKHEELDAAMSEQARAEAGLRAAQRREALGQLSGGIAHDFNNVLAVIVGYAELATERTDDPAMRDDLAEVITAAQRGAALTRQLMLFAKPELSSGEPADLNAVIEELTPLLRRTVGEDVAVVVDVDPAPSVVNIVAGDLEQVLVNLVVNARHAISGSGLITVRTRNDVAGHHVVLEVADDGSGMPADVAARACEPFFTTRPPGEGSGLGLATVDSIVQRANGVVTVDSTEGKGTTIRVVLPLVDQAITPAAPSARARTDMPFAATVLLVEDEEPVRRAMRRMLEERGYRVHEAVSGADAVTRYLDTCVPDVLLTDVVMPGGVSGSDLVDRFRTRHPGLPVIFVSGHAASRFAERGFPAAPVQLLSKPFSERELVAAVSAAIEPGGS